MDSEPSLSQTKTSRGLVEFSSSVPYVIRIYTGLLVLFGLLMILCLYFSRPETQVSDVFLERTFSTAMDGLKTVLGALLGALSFKIESAVRSKGSAKG